MKLSRFPFVVALFISILSTTTIIGTPSKTFAFWFTKGPEDTVSELLNALRNLDLKKAVSHTTKRGEPEAKDLPDSKKGFFELLKEKNTDQDPILEEASVELVELFLSALEYDIEDTSTLEDEASVKVNLSLVDMRPLIIKYITGAVGLLPLAIGESFLGKEGDATLTEMATNTMLRDIIKEYKEEGPSLVTGLVTVNLIREEEEWYVVAEKDGIKIEGRELKNYFSSMKNLFTRFVSP